MTEQPRKDIVERLRWASRFGVTLLQNGAAERMMAEAADEIDRLKGILADIAAAVGDEATR